MIADSFAELAYSVSREQLRGQKEDLRNARSVAATSVAAAGIIATLFATLAKSPPAACDSVCFLGVAAIYWLTLLPVFFSFTFAALASASAATCTFEISPKWIMGQGVVGETYSDTLKQLASDCEEYFDKNELVIRKVQNQVWWSMTLACAQVPGWVVIVFGGQ